MAKLAVRTTALQEVLSALNKSHLAPYGAQLSLGLAAATAFAMYLCEGDIKKWGETNQQNPAAVWFSPEQLTPPPLSTAGQPGNM